MRGEQALLERLAENLVENGVRYNAPGGFVAVHTGARDGEALLRVVNSGPPVPAATAERLLEPFERGGRARDDRGAGLGLSIVRSVAEAHGGRVALGSRAPRAGSRSTSSCRGPDFAQAAARQGRYIQGSP